MHCHILRASYATVNKSTDLMWTNSTRRSMTSYKWFRASFFHGPNKTRAVFSLLSFIYHEMSKWFAQTENYNVFSSQCVLKDQLNIKVYLKFIKRVKCFCASKFFCWIILIHCTDYFPSHISNVKLKQFISRFSWGKNAYFPGTCVYSIVRYGL